MRKYIVQVTFITLALAMLISTVSCGGENKANETKDKQKARETPVEVIKPKIARMEDTLNLTATAYSDDRVPVYSETTGIVEGKPVEESTMVKKGQVLARLKRQELELSLRKSQSSLDKAQADFNRSKKLFDDHLVSQDTFDQTRYAYEQAKIARDQARVELSKATIVAPISGVVAERMIRLGNLVKPQQQLFTIVDLSSVKASLFVPEKRVGDVKVGSPVRVRSDTFPGHVFEGKVERIAPVADSNTGTFKVTVALANKNRELRPGMFLSTSVVLSTHPEAIVVPKKCIVYEDDKTFVFIVRKNRAEKVEVQPGLTDQMNVEIVKGISPADQVISEGQSSLKDGAPITILSEANKQELPAGTKSEKGASPASTDK